MKGNLMTYSLYRVDDPTENPTTGISLGESSTFEDALEARDDDTAQLFAVTAAGGTLLVHHQIVGPGTAGPATRHPVSSGLPRSTPATLEEVAETRRWLREIHRLA
jgi:hypothetical protein